MEVFWCVSKKVPLKFPPQKYVNIPPIFFPRTHSTHMPRLADKLRAVLQSTASSQRCFSEQSGGQRKRNLRCFRLVLDALAGGDGAALLACFFASREGRAMREQLGLESFERTRHL